MGDTAIGWTDKTWNPTTGCTKVSPGCKNCYAEALTERFGRQKFTDVVLHPERLDYPLRWRKPQRIFVNSMSDLFHEDVPFEFVAEVFHVMTGECGYEAPPNHTYQILTKRPQRMSEFFRWVEDLPSGAEPFMSALQTLWFHDAPSRRVHLGVSVENQDAFDERWPLLRDTPAAVRFISFEPLLGPVRAYEALRWKGIQWGIIGGESGPKHRPMQMEWLTDLAEQHRACDVPVFVKQDSGRFPERQGRIPDDVWALKEFPEEAKCL